MFVAMCLVLEYRYGYDCVILIRPCALFQEIPFQPWALSQMDINVKDIVKIVTHILFVTCVD